MYQSQNTCYPRDIRDRETDVWISKLWLFNVNRNVMILPRLKYFTHTAATIQASVCQARCLTISQKQQVDSKNIFATWTYSYIFRNNLQPRSSSRSYWSLILSPYIRLSLAEHPCLPASVVSGRVISQLSSPALAHCPRILEMFKYFFETKK